MDEFYIYLAMIGAIFATGIGVLILIYVTHKPNKDDRPAWLRNGEEGRGPWGKDE